MRLGIAGWALVCAALCFNSQARGATTDPCSYIKPSEAAAVLGSGPLHATSNVQWTGAPATVPSCAYAGPDGSPLLVQAANDSDVAATQPARLSAVQMVCNLQPNACASAKASARAKSVADFYAAESSTPGVKALQGIGDGASYYRGSVFAVRGHLWIHVAVLDANDPGAEAKAERLAKIAISRAR